MRDYASKPPWLTQVYIYDSAKRLLDELHDFTKFSRAAILSVLIMEGLRNAEVLKQYLLMVTHGLKVKLKFKIELDSLERVEE
uniref:Uncharacterized protein n=1 Tax=Fervidobacterium pennivorans TaxID=93466 RepID=A0A7C4WD14_FERPE